jgi:hypothetical protein
VTKALSEGHWDRCRGKRLELKPQELKIPEIESTDFVEKITFLKFPEIALYF